MLQEAWETTVAAALRPQELHPASSLHPKSTRTYLGAYERPSKRHKGVINATGTSVQACCQT